jgi:hypothetical protein
MCQPFRPDDSRQPIGGSLLIRPQGRSPGRLLSPPAFTHSQAYLPGRLASPHSKPLLIAHSPAGPPPRKARSPACSALDCFANARNDGLHGRFASFPVFTHSQALSHGRLDNLIPYPLHICHIFKKSASKLKQNSSSRVYMHIYAGGKL